MTSDASNRWLETRSVSGDAYDATYERRAAAGENVHGEADFVERFAPASCAGGEHCTHNDEALTVMQALMPETYGP